MATFKRINGKLTYVGPEQVVAPPMPKSISFQDILNGVDDLEIDEAQVIAELKKWNAEEVKATLVKTGRTALQALVWSLSITLPVTIGTVHDWSTAKAAGISVGVSAINAAGTAAVTFIHNKLEDSGIIRSRKG
jgi:hypothetical protein